MGNITVVRSVLHMGLETSTCSAFVEPMSISAVPLRLTVAAIIAVHTPPQKAMTRGTSIAHRRYGTSFSPAYMYVMKNSQVLHSFEPFPVDSRT